MIGKSNSLPPPLSPSLPPSLLPSISYSPSLILPSILSLGTNLHIPLTVRMSVRSSYNHHPTVKERSEEPLENHGVCYVCHLELIEAEKVGLTCDVPGHGTDGIIGVRFLPTSRAWQLLLEVMNPCRVTPSCRYRYRKFIIFRTFI